MIQAVIFDIDGVLLDSFEANLKFYQDLMVAFGYPPPSREQYPAVFHLTMHNAIKKLTGLTDEIKINEVFEAGKNRKTPYRTDLLSAPAGVEKIIKQLHARYALGLVTSRIRETIYEAPQMAKLKKYFKVAICAYDTDKHKPEPEPLLLCAQKLGLPPTACVYIGDVENDVRAAKAAGMKMIVYSKNSIAGADYCTASFQAIPALVAALELKAH